MAKIYAIPGFACTEKLFERLHLKDHEFKVLQWPVPEKHYDMKKYAERFLPQINTKEEFYLLGVSFGGMICAELAEIIKPVKTIIISGCINRNEIPILLKLLKIFPLHLVLSQKMHIRLGSNTGWFIGIKKDQKKDLRAMMEQMHPRYFHLCAGYIVNWKRTDNAAEFVRIHGSSDRLLWYRNIPKVDYTIENGTHAAVVYQADEISRIIDKIVSS